MAGALIDSLEIGCEPERWQALGFHVTPEGTCRLGRTVLRLRSDGTAGGIRAWTLRAAKGDGPVDGLPTMRLPGPPTAPGADAEVEHPNSAVAIDHVVVRTPDFERTLEAMDAAGMKLRMTREGRGGLQQGFFRHGEAILEVVGPPEPQGSEPAHFWGLVATVRDIEQAARIAGPRLGEVRAAVQRGRRIATVGEQAGLNVRLALISR